MNEGTLLSIVGFLMIGASGLLYWLNKGRK